MAPDRVWLRIESASIALPDPVAVCCHRVVEFTEIDRDDLRRLLEEIGQTHMPFGKFGPNDYPPRGVPIIDLPPEYLAWFKERGFPKGRLGELMSTVYEIKESGADAVFQPIRVRNGGRTRLRPARRRVFDFDQDESPEE